MMAEYTTPRQELRAALAQIERELRQNEQYLRSTNHYYAHYQNRTYDRVYELLKQAQAAVQRLEP